MDARRRGKSSRVHSAPDAAVPFCPFRFGPPRTPNEACKVPNAPVAPIRVALPSSRAVARHRWLTQNVQQLAHCRR